MICLTFVSDVSAGDAFSWRKGDMEYAPGRSTANEVLQVFANSFYKASFFPYSNPGPVTYMPVFPSALYIRKSYCC